MTEQTFQEYCDRVRQLKKRVTALEQEPTDDKCHYCEHNFTPYQGNTGEFTEQEPTDKSNLEKICEELAAENDDLRDQLAMRDRFKQEPCDDVVSRQSIINSIANTNFWLSSDNWDELMEAINKVPTVRSQEPFGPCDLCRFNPPSSADGKPCTMCPAEKGGE